MNIHLIPRHFKLTDSIHQFTMEKLLQLNELAPDVQSADVVLEQDGSVNPEHQFTAKVRLALPGKDIHASETGNNLYAAIDRLQNKLARLLRKRKTRIEMRRTKHQRAVELQRGLDVQIPASAQPEIA